jgi:hypothetical protein
VVDSGPAPVKPKTIQLICVASPQRPLHKRVKVKTGLHRNQDNVSGWIGMYTGYKNPTKRVGLENRGYHLIKYNDIAEQLLICH